MNKPAMPTTYKERDELIIKLNAEGLSFNNLALKFNLSAQRIKQIVYRNEQLLRSISNTEDFVAEIKRIDDVTFNWNTDELIDKLNFPFRASKCLHNYLNRLNLINISLEQFANLIIVDSEKQSDDLFLIVPLCREYQVGRKTVSSIVLHLYNFDLGENFNAMWKNKVNKLIHFFTSREEYLPLAFRDIKATNTKG